MTDLLDLYNKLSQSADKALSTTLATTTEFLAAMIKDPQLVELAEKLKKTNELYEMARMITDKHKSEIEELNRQIGDLLQSKKKDKDELDKLKARLNVLIREMQQ